MTRRLAVLTAILLIGAALRVRGLDTMLGMAHYDESYYGIDALSLVAQPRLTPFFPANFGRESLWMYILAPSLAIFGGGSFGLRLVAIFTGVLTLAATYRLARELIGRRGAIWAAAALAVLFWHVLASHEAFRALLFPLVGALAFAYLWGAHRTNRPRLWMAAGVFLGLLAYTYFAARVWIALAGVMLLWWWLRGQRRGVISAAVIAGVIGLPLLIYILTNPAAADQRIDQVAITGIDQLVNNIGAWLRVWVDQGATDVVYNLPGRPLLDLPLALLFVAGIGALIVRRDRSSWLILLAGASVAPALLTTDPLKWLRAIGLNVPLAIGLGLGALAIERGIKWIARRGGFQTRPVHSARNSCDSLAGRGRQYGARLRPLGDQPRFVRADGAAYLRRDRLDRRSRAGRSGLFLAVLARSPGAAAARVAAGRSPGWRVRRDQLFSAYVRRIGGLFRPDHVRSRLQGSAGAVGDRAAALH